jgi:hypothetical protein
MSAPGPAATPNGEVGGEASGVRDGLVAVGF